MNQSIVLIVIIDSDTIVTISNETSFAISITSLPLQFMTDLSAGNVKILEGFKLILLLLYYKYCTSNLTLIIINDEENYSVYLAAISNNVALNLIPVKFL